ncbi:TetR/AcrR family transcriptional regulator [Clostridium sporogenes]|uniref:TetR/AcrR family transcriptional regulator n=1 Tax=Clostridium sporogenes TaxID=1509 RepID=UPI002237E606|nr:TetR/AcrR family transcriptional regulator [Clostridium sporogenes]EKS4344594.1 TetR/AcrR family transcriptional regulator [Clostridium botulinum]EKS4395067.1 TetR/AcrR family transcriptional regulator [Clostridium botulinum]MCW6077704.1 TetR/AcrR family transcriptional regulator [Clostridium sporogenes]
MRDKKAEIFNCGRELFCSKGFKDTNISDITKMAGMGVGTFYNYYSSKEKLFIEIFIKENEKLKKNIMESIDLEDDPIKVVKEAIALNLNGTNANPILKEWYNKDFFSKLEKEFYEAAGIESIYEFMNKGTIELIKKWKAERKIRDDLDDKLILAIFNSIPYIDIHKEQIGIQYFPQIIDYLAEFIMKGLTDWPK